MRRVALLLTAVLVLGSIGAAASPAFAGSDKDDKKSSKSAKAAKKIKNCKKDKNLDENIQAAFIPFFTGETAAEKIEAVQDGDAILPMVEESTAAAREGGQVAEGTVALPVAVSATCDGKKAATFTYDIAINLPRDSSPPSTGLGLEFAGDAVLEDGKWVITALTICDLIVRNPDTPDLGQRCQEAALG